MEAVGPVPERAAVGHGARGLQRRRRRLGLLHATTRRARAPTAGARTASPASRDDKQRLCFALALWNGKDPILKERLFGLTNSEGNHGEDVKEYYFYLDSTPTHSYMKCLYKYPQAAYPVRRPGGDQPRARPRRSWSTSCSTPASSTTTATSTSSSSTPRRRPRTSSIRITVANRGPEPATLHLLPTLWFRNTWSWWPERAEAALRQAGGATGRAVIAAVARRARRALALLRGRAARCCSPRTRPTTSGSSAAPNATPYVKDGINDYVVHGRRGRGEPGADAAPRPRRTTGSTVGAGQTAVIRAAPHRRRADARGDPVRPAFDATFAARLREADEFYALDHAAVARAEDEARVMRQALAGMLWTQAVLLLRRRHAGSRSTAPTRCSASARTVAQPRVVPHGERRRHLDAGQVGVPVVRGLGSRLPRDRARGGRPRLRQASSST